MTKMVVFDMAGTTVDENMVVYKTLQQAVNEAGYNFSLEQVLAVGAGQEKLSAIKDVLRVYAQKEDDQLADSIFRNFTVMLEKAYDTLEIFSQAHAKETFEGLKKRKMLVVLNTGYSQKTAQSLVDKLGWKKGVEFDGLVTATDVLHNRPKPDMILLAMKQFGITDGAEVVKVGDSIIDIEEGRNAGCGLSIGITTGAHTKEQLDSAKPDYVIDDLIELLPIVDKAGA